MPKPVYTQSSSRRRRWRAADARAVLATLATSGLSLPAFASREGLEPERLRRWQRRFAREERLPARGSRPRPGPAGPTAPTAPAVIELRPSPRPAEPVEIVLVSGVVLRVAEAVDPAALARLVAALRGC
jgi:hypothetical protein